MAGLLIVLTLAARAQTFGNPLIGFDEQFYLLVGDRMIRGAVPYVDLWDRKPIGLFLIYAAIRMLGGEGTLQYQIVAAAFVATTAFLTFRFARRMAGPLGSIAAAAGYILWLNFTEGEGGQAPVFFNLPMLVAAMLVCDVWTGRRAGALVGGVAMLAIGIALQIKYSVVFEGLVFGLLMLWAQFRRGAGLLRLGLYAGVWASAALLPTLAAMAAYWRMGQFDAFYFANFVSFFGKGGVDGSRLFWGALTFAGITAPLLLPAVAGGLRAGLSPAHRFTLIWLAAAIAGLVPFISTNPHPIAGILVPLAASAAPWFDRHRRIVFGVLIAGFVGGQAVLAATRYAKGGPSQARAIAIAADPGKNCLYVYDGYPALYRLTNSCLPTRFPFPGHLNTAGEAHVAALGIDPVAEVRRILAAAPGTIVTVRPAYARGNPETRRLVDDELVRHYRLVLDLPMGGRHRLVYRRRAD